MTKGEGPGYFGFRVIGSLKLISGVAALFAGFYAIRFLEHDPAPELERMSIRLGLDPQNRIIHSAITSVTGIDRGKLRAIQAGTFFYAILHTVEGIGLLLRKDWAGYLLVIATSTLVPFEIYEIFRKPTAVRIAVFLLNIALVVYVIITLRAEARARASGHVPGT